MSARVEYAPGEAWCIAAGRVVLVCERDLPTVRARALHDAAAVTDSVDALRTILELEPAALLGLVDLDDDRVLLRRHGVPATADDHRLADRFGAEWALDAVDAASVVEAGGLASLAEDVLPLEGGVVRVAAVRVATRSADAPAEGMLAAGEPGTDVSGEDDAPRTGAFGETVPPRRAEEWTRPAPGPEHGAYEQATPEQPSSEVQPGPEVQPDPEVEPDPEVQPSPEQAAPAGSEPERAAEEPVALAVPPVAPTHPIGGLIDSVPGFIRPAVDLHVAEPPAVEAPAAPAALDAGDHDGMTITAEQARRMQAERGGAAVEQPTGASTLPGASAPATGPLVLSTLCASGHVNAPGTRTCARCGQPVDDGSAAQRPRPEVAVVVLPSGERVPLGRGVVLGRRPRSRRAESGRVPRLVPVESPSEDISRSHLELRVEDWNIVGVDLSSTNGTLLLRDGAAPQRLRPEASTILQLGDRLDLGDGVIVSIEGAP